MIYAKAGSSFRVTVPWDVTGLTGQIGVRVLDASGTAVIARTTAGITEMPAGSGVYSVSLTAPTDVGAYLVYWDAGAPLTTNATEDLVVTPTGELVVVDPGPDVLTLLKLFTDATSEPVVTDDELNAVLARWRVTDVDGLAPPDDTWTPTYDVNQAASEVWRIKAGRLAGHYNFMTGGKMFSRQQFYDHCKQMAKWYASRGRVYSVRLGRHDYLRPALGDPGDLSVIGNA